MARIDEDGLNRYVANAPKRQAELDAIATANITSNANTIKQLQELGVGAPATTAVNPSTGKPVVTRAGQLAADVEAAKKAGPPYEAPPNTHWTLIGSKWTLYKDLNPTQQTGKTVVSTSTNANGDTIIVYSDGTTQVVPGSGNSNKTKTTDNTAAIIANQNAIAAAQAAAEAAKTAAQREAVGKILQDTFAKYGLGSLANKVMDLARQGYTEATITLELQNTPEYKARFIANEDRLKKNLAVLSPAEYVASEDAYRQTLRAYGLNQFDNDVYVRQFIANDVSAAELSSRVSLAVQRVQNADPAITQTLRDYYGIGQSDMVAYILDPNQTLPKIQQQVAAAEIGSAARLQGLEAGVSVSEQLARQGITQAEAQKGYATIADILPTAEKLSQIYGTEAGYGQAEAEQEVFNSLASAQRKRRALSARETASFSGAAGTTRTSLTSSNQGSF